MSEPQHNNETLVNINVPEPTLNVNNYPNSQGLTPLNASAKPVQLIEQQKNINQPNSLVYPVNVPAPITVPYQQNNQLKILPTENNDKSNISTTQIHTPSNRSIKSEKKRFCCECCYRDRCCCKCCYRDRCFPYCCYCQGPKECSCCYRQYEEYCCLLVVLGYLLVILEYIALGLLYCISFIFCRFERIAIFND